MGVAIVMVLIGIVVGVGLSNLVDYIAEERQAKREVERREKDAERKMLAESLRQAEDAYVKIHRHLAVKHAQPDEIQALVKEYNRVVERIRNIEDKLAADCCHSKSGSCTRCFVPPHGDGG